MKLICGLGNLERKYVGTRHNVGFMVVDKIAEEFSVDFQKSKHNALIAEFRTEIRIQKRKKKDNLIPKRELGNEIKHSQVGAWE